MAAVEELQLPQSPATVEELQLPQPPLEVVINIQQALILSSIKDRLFKEHHDPKGDPQRLRRPTIYRVRTNIRNEDPKSYRPQVVAIGPYHRGDTPLFPMERLKEQYLHDLLARDTSNRVDDISSTVDEISVDDISNTVDDIPNRVDDIPNTVDDIPNTVDEISVDDISNTVDDIPNTVDDISNRVDEYVKALSDPNFLDSANRRYSEPVVLSEEGNAFVEMMVLDGCFIIEFLIKSVLNEYMGQLDFVNFDRSVIQNDLLLLENQIPFQVLERLYKVFSRKGLDKYFGPDFRVKFGPPTLENLYFRYISGDRVGHMPQTSLNIHHLLHLHHSFLAPAGNMKIRPESWTFRSVPHYLWQHFIIPALSWLLLYLLSFRRPPPYKRLMEMEMPTSIPNATDMDDFGIKFEIKETGCLLDVTFRVSDGVMEMPQLRIQALTVSQFRNLLAFEQCCPDAGCHFTAYVMLMDSLIDEPNDVAVLERSGVLQNKLGAREEVAKFFNILGKGIYLNYPDHCLSGLFKVVREYRACERNKRRATIHKWKEILKQMYFNNPWSTCSLVAAVLVVLLTVAQTYMTFLAYYRPPTSA